MHEQQQQEKIKKQSNANKQPLVKNQLPVVRPLIPRVLGVGPWYPGTWYCSVLEYLLRVSPRSQKKMSCDQHIYQSRYGTWYLVEYLVGVPGTGTMHHLTNSYLHHPSIHQQELNIS